MPGAILGGYYVGGLYETVNLEVFENQVARLNRLALLGGLSAEMAHEIAGPLSVIANNADLILEENGVDHDARQSLIAIRNEADRLSVLLRDFLLLSRDTPLEVRPHDIVKLIETPVRLLRHQALRKNVTLEIEAEPDIPQVSGNAERLQQVFFNLIKNACEATRPGSEVRIEVRPDWSAEKEEMLEVAIIDQGEGIDPHQAEHIFEPFYSTKPAKFGTGLGLPISRRIVEAHHGDMTITNVPPMGARAVVKLPVAR
jgi:signal transduction histidine kinase